MPIKIRKMTVKISFCFFHSKTLTRLTADGSPCFMCASFFLSYSRTGCMNQSPKNLQALHQKKSSKRNKNGSSLFCALETIKKNRLQAERGSQTLARRFFVREIIMKLKVRGLLNLISSSWLGDYLANKLHSHRRWLTNFKFREDLDLILIRC